MTTSFYSIEELKKLGINFNITSPDLLSTIQISRKASLYDCSNITVSDHVRIDDFCILSGKINIGHNVHISAYSSLFAGSAGIEIRDYVGISSRCAIYGESDDYSGAYMTNPTIPDEYKNVISQKVIFEMFTLVGTGCTILPGVTIHEGTSVGCMSLINKDLDAWGIYVGIPCRRIRDRKKDMLRYVTQYESKYRNCSVRH